MHSRLACFGKGGKGSVARLAIFGPLSRLSLLLHCSLAPCSLVPLLLGSLEWGAHAGGRPVTDRTDDDDPDANPSFTPMAIIVVALVTPGHLTSPQGGPPRRDPRPHRQWSCEEKLATRQVRELLRKAFSRNHHGKCLPAVLKTGFRAPPSHSTGRR